MSDHWIAIIPRNINSTVDLNALHQVADEMRRIAPEADEVEVIHGDVVRMFDCGGNLETIGCPACKGELDTQWWQDRVDDGYDEDDESFDLKELELPCCGHRCTLNDLRYDFDQGFSRIGASSNP